jgi:hypothetical protein
VRRTFLVRFLLPLKSFGLIENGGFLVVMVGKVHHFGASKKVSGL